MDAHKNERSYFIQFGASVNLFFSPSAKRASSGTPRERARACRRLRFTAGLSDAGGLAPGSVQ
jgi:hypothetical protein